MTYRYVDDTNVAIKTIYVQEFHDHINGIDPHIKFTIETSNDGCLPFLDTLVCRREDGHLYTKVYKKPTHTNQYLAFDSNHQASTKIGIIRTLYLRAKTIITEPTDLEQENMEIEQCLSNCGYPKWALRRGKQSVYHPTPTRQTPNDPTDQPKSTIVLPYVRGLSENLRRIFNKHKIRTCFKCNDTLRSALVKLKDPIPVFERSGVVYEVPCKCSATYVGETKRQLHERITQHRRDTSGQSAITDHRYSCNHQIDWDNVRVIGNEDNFHKRKIKEAIKIHQLAPNMNRDKGVFIDPIYHQLLSRPSKTTVQGEGLSCPSPNSRQ